MLALGSNGLRGEIPTELGTLSSLVSLGLVSNHLTGEIPSELGSLSSLEALTLGGNGLTGEIPSELGSLSSLEVLALSNNGLTGEIPPVIGGLTNLRGLYVHANQLVGQLPESFLALSLDLFWWHDNAALCAPNTSAFQTWLAGIRDHRPGAYCGRGPEAVGTIPPQTLEPDGETSLDVSSYFRDPDGDALTYTASKFQRHCGRGHHVGERQSRSGSQCRRGGNGDGNGDGRRSGGPDRDSGGGRDRAGRQPGSSGGRLDSRADPDPGSGSDGWRVLVLPRSGR